MSVSWTTLMQGLGGRAAISAMVRLRDTTWCSRLGDSQKMTLPSTISMDLHTSEGRASYSSSVMRRLEGSVAHAGSGMLALLGVGSVPGQTLSTVCVRRRANRSEDVKR